PRVMDGQRLLICTALVGALGVAARPSGSAEGQNGSAAPPIRITSPLGRTGIVGRVRIVAQVHSPADMLSPGSFFVDGTLAGMADAAQFCAVDWTDENPFERREIVVEATDNRGQTLRDVVVLPPFEITDTTEVSSVLLETGVYDQTGRFASELDPAS